MEDIPNGEYEATVGVRHNTSAFILDMQVNGASVFDHKQVNIKGKDGKNGAWTESSVVILINSEVRRAEQESHPHRRLQREGLPVLLGQSHHLQSPRAPARHRT